MKYYFNTRQEFEANKNMLKKKSIAFIRDTREIYSEGNFYKTPVELIQGIGSVSPYGYKTTDPTDDLADFTYISNKWEKVDSPDMGTFYYCLMGIDVKDNEEFQVKVNCVPTELVELLTSVLMFSLDGNIEDSLAGEELQPIEIQPQILEDNTLIYTIPSQSGEHQIYLNIYLPEEYQQELQQLFGIDYPEISVSIINKKDKFGSLKDNIDNQVSELMINLHRIDDDLDNTNQKVKFLLNNANFAYVGIDRTNSSSLVDHINRSWIKGKRCLAKHISDDEGVAICYLDDNDSNYFHDGTTEAKLDGTMGEVMVDTPDIWYNATSNGDQYDFYMTNEEVAGYHRYRRVLIGAFEGTVVSNILHSRITGGQSTGRVTPVNFHLYANALGKGWDIVDYETHCKIAWMQMAKYGDRNSQKLIGNGSNSSSRIIGSTSTLGNNDGTDNVNISLFGLENWWGDKYEWMGGLYEWKDGSTGYIYQFDGFLNSTSITGDPLTMGLVSSENDYRVIDTVTASNIGYISDMKLGEYGDLIPTKYKGGSSTYYTDSGYVNFGSNVADRSCIDASSNGGVFYLTLGFLASVSFYNSGSRLQFRGKIRVIEDPQEFINL